jgi:hypothetical protein
MSYKANHSINVAFVNQFCVVCIEDNVKDLASACLGENYLVCEGMGDVIKGFEKGSNSAARH